MQKGSKRGREEVVPCYLGGSCTIVVKPKNCPEQHKKKFTVMNLSRKLLYEINCLSTFEVSPCCKLRGFVTLLL